MFYILQLLNFLDLAKQLALDIFKVYVKVYVALRTWLGDGLKPLPDL